MAMTQSNTGRVLLVYPAGRGDPLRVTIPAKARITFAKVNPQSKGGYDGEALRIYEGTSQIACFTNIKTFHDTSKITVQRRVTHVEEEIERDQDGQGNRKAKERRRVDHEWVGEEGL